MSPTPAVPCRLSIILAREVPIGVIFRRGPSKWTQIIKWNTDSDTFESGAWFHGQIYPGRCDLSPDGAHLIYFAADYSDARSNNDFPSNWTAISKVPWLTALAVWPNATTYFGGGLFESNSSVWVNPDCKSTVHRPDYEPQGLEVSYDHKFWDHEWHLLFRLKRDGWKAIETYPQGSVPVYRLQPQEDGFIELDPAKRTKMEATNPGCELLMYIRTVHQKVAPHGENTLIMTSTYDYINHENNRTFEIRNNHRKMTVALADATWADLDHQGRFLYAKEGKLWAARMEDSGEVQSKELADFNASRPRRTKSPAWARKW